MHVLNLNLIFGYCVQIVTGLCFETKHDVNFSKQEMKFHYIPLTLDMKSSSKHEIMFWNLMSFENHVLLVKRQNHISILSLVSTILSGLSYLMLLSSLNTANASALEWEWERLQPKSAVGDTAVARALSREHFMHGDHPGMRKLAKGLLGRMNPRTVGLDLIRATRSSGPGTVCLASKWASRPGAG